MKNVLQHQKKNTNTQQKHTTSWYGHDEKKERKASKRMNRFKCVCERARWRETEKVNEKIHRERIGQEIDK